MSRAQIQYPAPNVTVEAALPDGSIGEISLADYRGQYVVLFFYPLDFTFVCPTEIYAFADGIAEFAQRDCAVLGVSVDSVHAHLAWRRTPRNEGGSAPFCSRLSPTSTSASRRRMACCSTSRPSPCAVSSSSTGRGSCAACRSTTSRWGATSTRCYGCSMPCSSTSSTARSARPTGSAARRA